MKKAIAILSAVFFMSVPVMAGEKTAIKDTPYFYAENEDNLFLTIYDKEDNILSENKYDRIKNGGGNIIVRVPDTGYRTGILDQNFNFILEPRFSEITFNEHTQVYECLTWGEGVDKIEYFNLNIEPVAQPRDVRQLVGTDCYFERVLENDPVEISDGYITYYICDSEGNRLLDEAYSDIKSVSGKIVVTDMKSVTNTYNDTAQLVSTSGASIWARESINNAISLGIVPKELQSAYTNKITRAEFCRLAVETYIASTGYKIDSALESPFTDISDSYVTTAYNLKIVAGVGNNKFAPHNSITRQEAAVMLNNLAKLLGADGSGNINKFVDDSYFAAWAKEAIYNISSIKSGDTYVMAGTGAGKFSPWMNYTREQAIATMLRLYNNDGKEPYYDGQFKQPTGGDWLYYDSNEIIDNEIYYTIVRVKKDGSEFQTLVKNSESVHINTVIDNYIYYTSYDESMYCHYYRMNLDGSNVVEITENEMKGPLSLAKKESHDEHYVYFLEEEPYMRSYVNYLTRKNSDGSNKIRLYDNIVYSKPILYKGYVYIVAAAEENEIAILKFDSQGKYENITKNIPLEIPSESIIKIEDDRIYYRVNRDVDDGVHSLYIVSDDDIYSMNTDGSDNRLIYSPEKQKSD